MSVSIIIEDQLDLVGNSQLSGTLTVAGTDTLVVCLVSSKLAADAPAPTYNGVSMTEDTVSPVVSGSCCMHMFYLFNPAAGGNTLVTTGSNNKNMALKAWALSNVDQHVTFRSSKATVDGGTNFIQFDSTVSSPITSEPGDLVIGGASDVRDPMVGVGANQVNAFFGDAGAIGYGFSNEPAADPGTETNHKYEQTATKDACIIGMVLIPSTVIKMSMML